MTTQQILETVQALYPEYEGTTQIEYLLSNGCTPLDALHVIVEDQANWAEATIVEGRPRR